STQSASPAPPAASTARPLATLAARAAPPTRATRHAPGAWRSNSASSGASTTSVANGLAVLAAGGAGDADWVLVHDAARCLVQPADIERLIAACEHDAVGGLLALPVADTLKREAGSRVAATLDRRGVWQAQTPQMFRLGLLRAALAAAGDAVTDEASAIEALGHAPKLVPGALENFKLTWPADFALAERLLRTRA
ncbi:MAG TPA: 2-C-methyl-D-erythritol 4-phosphate cytidylyltransferase, partial [Methylibium sp.]|nr:2-C-methyl-D-erythritol 4-phosphate cytidylyltransferase [Methylibium sp.]